ncbi:MAG: glutathione-regulated potassium-efflux system protein KefB [Betaproteobacteria bacterium]|nr:glutathione-regulated potassium-efflux system protein KefB [Betaproteobacteria bacterium]
MPLLAQTAVFLAAAVVMVPVFRKLKLGAVLGFLVAGLAIGPWGLRIVTEVQSIMHFAELGVVLLLFIIGLELQPSRLWALRRSVFGLGAVQVGATGLAVGSIAYALGSGWQVALVIGVALSMNSTAFVLQLLGERHQLTTRHGRAAFAISLFQDMAVIPMLAIVPLLVVHDRSGAAHAWLGALKAAAVIAAVIVGGRYLLRPVLKAVAESGIQEIFTAAALLVVIGTALIMEGTGLSMTLGAFLAGVLLADSEYRHEIEASIEPFKGLLLGLFFITVGMGVNMGLLLERPAAILGAALGLMFVKAAIVFGLAAGARHGAESARSLAVLLAHAGEFAFVLFGVGLESGLLERGTADFLVVVVTVSMALTPILFLVHENVVAPRLRKTAPPAYDEIDDDDDDVPVIIAGVGRVGQIVSRILTARRIPYTALDINPEQVDTIRRVGRKAYYGDASKLDLLRAAKADRARVFVLAIDDVEASVRTALTVRKHFPHLAIHARARNRIHAHRLAEIGARLITRETFASSLEMARHVLEALGTGESEARETVTRFREHDESVLRRQFAARGDEETMIQTSREAAQELQDLFDTDRAESPPIGEPSAADLARNWK